MEKIIAKLKYLSNLDYCTSAGEMQQALEDINDLLNEAFPDIQESDFTYSEIFTPYNEEENFL